MFFVIKHFQQNYFLEKMIFLKIFFDVWLVRKNHQQRQITGDEIPSLVGRIPTVMTRFQLVSPGG
jgi:hypothetical protein